MSTSTSTSSKPMNQNKFRKFSLGLNGGALNPAVAIGGSNDFTHPITTFGYGANLKYQISRLVAIQADFVRGTLKGNQSKALYEGGPASNRPIYAFETDLHYAISGSGVLTLSALDRKNKVVPYLSAGAGIASYDVKIANNTSRTQLTTYPANSPIKEFFVPVGMGLKFNVANMLNLDLGYRMHFVDGNNLDGARLGVGNHKDKFQYGFLGFEFPFGNKSNEQLMFYDPLARINDQLTRMQVQIDTLFARMSIVDTDGDGVIDQFDREPNTAAGCPVNTHGESLDTDGDGVPDCRDKEKVTPTFCQPVDADGVGKCPPPECCNNMVKETGSGACALGDLPSISFRGNLNMLSADAKAMLATVASKVKSNPNCTVTVTGYPAASKASQALCNRRLESIKNYLVENEAINSERIQINCNIGGGDTNTVDITGN
ncbi:MAG: OmpA family protein [Ginsengibacter sp.]